MSGYTPTTEEVREAWLTAEHEERDPFSTSDDDLRAEFDRWLAAHDAEILEKAAQRVEALEPKLDMSKWDGGYDCCGCPTLYRLFDEAVDGPVTDLAGALGAALGNPMVSSASAASTGTPAMRHSDLMRCPT